MSKSSLSDEEIHLKYHIINKYRGIISRRYDDVILHIDQTGVNLSPDIAREIKDFFLGNVYPAPAQRRRLDAAFAELGKFTTNPTLIWGLLGSLPVALFQFGAQLPHAIRAGVTSLHAYTSAIAFEEAMVRAAVEKGLTEPLSDEQFFQCLKMIPRKSLETFLYEASSLFIAISDTILLSKTINIMKDVITRMKSKPALYNTDQVEAIELGLDLMEKGYALLKPFSDETKKEIISFITENEMKFITEAHGY